jgi:hypothetical protein
LLPVSTTAVVHLELRISLRIFEKIQNSPNGTLRGLGKLNHEKLKAKISWYCPFKICLLVYIHLLANADTLSVKWASYYVL